MPQMSPLCWLCLFLFFTLLLILFSMMNYFIFIPSPLSKTSLTKSPLKLLPWKW